MIKRPDTRYTIINEIIKSQKIGAYYSKLARETEQNNKDLWASYQDIAQIFYNDARELMSILN